MNVEILNAVSMFFAEAFVFIGGWGLGMALLSRFVLNPDQGDKANSWTFGSWTILWVGVFFRYLV